ncbi:MAG TPA: hypothetical protein VJV39_06005 [Dongiaceae bacterium]|nr:hypothetical protein [Dongiaceae bacterium]
MQRSTARVGTFGLAVAVGLGLAPVAWAKPGFALVKLTPAKFVSNCQSQGGSTSQAPGGGIRCTLPGGQTVDCSFDTTTGDALCQWSRDLPPPSVKAMIGDVPPDSIAPTTTKPPKATGAPGTVN